MAPPPAADPPPPRRHRSELDMNALRRVGDALLLAQSRARRASERAAHSERLLQTVLARVDGATAAALRLEMDALVAGEELPRPPRLHVASSSSSGRRRAALEDAEDLEVARASREIVASLRGAGARHRLLADRAVAEELRAPSGWRRCSLAAAPLQFVAGLLLGACAGAALARALARSLAQSSPPPRPSLVRALSSWCRARARVGRYYSSGPASAPTSSPGPVLPFPLDDVTRWGFPAAVEVA